MFSIAAIVSLIQALLGFGDTIKTVSNDIARVREAARRAETDEKRIEMEGEAKALENRRDVLVAEATGSRWNQGFRIFLSLPAAIVLWKIVVWDQVLGWGVTANLGQNVWNYILMVCGFYLLNRAIQIAKR